MQNLNRGALARLGFGIGGAAREHPRLITVLDHRLWRGRALCRRKSYDLLIQAETGLAAITGVPPAPARVGVFRRRYSTGGMAAHAAMLEALIARGRTGQGADIRGLAVRRHGRLDERAAADSMTAPAGQPPKRVGLAHPSIAPYGAFLSKDGEPILISIQSEREWRALCEHVLRRPDALGDPRFASGVVRVREPRRHRRHGSRRVRDARPRRADRAADRGRYRLRRGQRTGRHVAPSASAPRHCRNRERAGLLFGTSGDLRRRTAASRGGAETGRAQE